MLRDVRSFVVARFITLLVEVASETIGCKTTAETLMAEELAPLLAVGKPVSASGNGCALIAPVIV